MALVRSGGGSEKVTIDGEKVKEKLNLYSSINYSRGLPTQIIGNYNYLYASGVGYDSDNKRYVIAGSNDSSFSPSIICTLDDSEAFNETGYYFEKKLDILSYTGVCDLITRKEEMYILLGNGQLRKIDKNLNSSTIISTCPNTNLNYLMTGAFYIQGLDSFYSFDLVNENHYSYNFSNNSWAKIPKGDYKYFGQKPLTAVKDGKIYFNAYDTFKIFDPQKNNYTSIETNLKENSGCLTCYENELLYFGQDPQNQELKNVIFKQLDSVVSWSKIGLSLYQVRGSSKKAIISTSKKNCFTAFNANNFSSDYSQVNFEQAYCLMSI